MKRARLKKDLELIHRHLNRAEVIMQKIATRLDIDRHEYLERTLFEVEELLKLFTEDNKNEQ